MRKHAWGQQTGCSSHYCKCKLGKNTAAAKKKLTAATSHQLAQTTCFCVEAPRGATAKVGPVQGLLLALQKGYPNSPEKGAENMAAASSAAQPERRNKKPLWVDVALAAEEKAIAKGVESTTGHEKPKEENQEPEQEEWWEQDWKKGGKDWDSWWQEKQREWDEWKKEERAQEKEQNRAWPRNEDKQKWTELKEEEDKAKAKEEEEDAERKGTGTLQGTLRKLCAVGPAKGLNGPTGMEAARRLPRRGGPPEWQRSLARTQNWPGWGQ